MDGILKIQIQNGAMPNPCTHTWICRHTCILLLATCITLAFTCHITSDSGNNVMAFNSNCRPHHNEYLVTMLSECLMYITTKKKLYFNESNNRYKQQTSYHKVFTANIIIIYNPWYCVIDHKRYNTHRKTPLLWGCLAFVQYAYTYTQK